MTEDEAGVVELMLDNGAQILLQGPADFELVSTKKAIARRGKLVMRCGPDAAGFEVESPDARIVDLGTVFARFIVLIDPIQYGVSNLNRHPR